MVWLLHALIVNLLNYLVHFVLNYHSPAEKRIFTQLPISINVFGGKLFSAIKKIHYTTRLVYRNNTYAILDFYEFSYRLFAFSLVQIRQSNFVTYIQTAGNFL